MPNFGPNSNQHQFPENDFFEHWESPYCHCKPQMQTRSFPGRGYRQVWVHHLVQYTNSINDIIEDWINGGTAQ